jgi:hypothetical protein
MFFAEAYATTGDQRWLNAAKQGARWMAANLVIWLLPGEADPCPYWFTIGLTRNVRQKGGGHVRAVH